MARVSVIIVERWKSFELENYWAKIYWQPGHGGGASFHDGHRPFEERMSAALYHCPSAGPLLHPSDLLLYLGSKGPDVSWSKNLSEMTQMCSWALPTCCSPTALSWLILACTSAAEGKRRKGPSSPHLSLYRSQTVLDKIAASFTGAEAT